MFSSYKRNCDQVRWIYSQKHILGRKPVYSARVPIDVNELSDATKLHWVNPKRVTERTHLHMYEYRYAVCAYTFIMCTDRKPKSLAELYSYIWFHVFIHE